MNTNAKQELVERDAESETLDVMVPPGQELATLGAISRAELDQQMVTARAFPRSIKRFVDKCRQGALMSQGSAEACSYILPRAGKNIEGPSIRFAEILFSSWPNANVATRIMDEGDEFVTVAAVFHDLEMNNRQGAEVKRRITDKNNKRFNTDMIGVTISAAQAIARRNVILAGVPRAYWWDIYEETRDLARGDINSLKDRRGKALDWFAKKGVTAQMVLEALGVAGIEDINLDHLQTLTGMKTAISEGTMIETVFAPKEVKAPTAKKPATEEPKTKPAGGKKKAATETKPAADATPAANAETKTPAADTTPVKNPVTTGEKPGELNLGEPAVSLDQATYLYDMLHEEGIDRTELCAKFEVGEVTQLPASKFKAAVAYIEERSGA